jgi:hypothetical protein
MDRILRSGKQLFGQMKHLYNSVLYEEREGFGGNLMSNITNTLLLRDGKVSRNSCGGVLSHMIRKALIIYGQRKATLLRKRGNASK